jgi:hypothetical protein
MKKQTAVEWLEEIIAYKDMGEVPMWIYELFDQAKAMEKEQMDKVSEDWFVEGCSHMKDNKRIYQSFEQYYIQTFIDQPEQ